MTHLNKLSITLFLSLILMNGAIAKEEKQEKAKKEISEDKAFNRSFSRWSLELNGGFNSLIPAGRTIVNSGVNGKFSTSRVSPFHIDLGARFMINRYVGIKTNISYDQVSPGFGVGKRDLSKITDFKGHYYGIDVEGVVNLGQIMHFPEFTGRFGLLGHSGVGYRSFKLDKDKIDLSVPGSNYATRIKRDNIIDFKWGITPQFRIIDRLVLTADFSQVLIFKQQTQLNGTRNNRGPVDAVLHTYTLGLTYNFGKKQHIDWAKKELATKKALDDLKNEYYKDREGIKGEIQSLRDEVNALNAKLNNAATNEDLDKLRNELNQTINDKLKSIQNSTEKGETILDLINSGSLATYFDFDVRTPQATSMQGIQQIADYLKANPNAKLTVTGYADAIGTKAYNNQLAQDRANNIKNILVQQGIDASRINAVSGGIDNSTNRNLARKASYNISK